jgi:uncharacterized protein (DUF58 family)
MLSPELLKKVDSIFIGSSRKANDIFAGEYESAFRGRGIEFEEFREYVPGDDVRQIDWNVTARLDKPFVKIFREERERTIFFLVDASRSLCFGQDKQKLDVATEIAALLAYAAIKSNDKVGLIIFSDQIEKFIPPKKGRGHVWQIVAALLSHEPKGVKTDIDQGIKFFLQIANRRSVCFLISDFFDVKFKAALKVANLRHEFVAIRILDRLEQSLPKTAIMDFKDLETGDVARVDMGSKTQGALDKQSRELQKYFGMHNIDLLDLLVDENYVDSLLKFFIQREKKR